MELIKEITEQSGDINLQYHVRKAARAILFNHEQQIALLYVSADDYHKLPGGGIEAGESIQAALEREVLEEVGARIEVSREVGLVIEYRNRFKQIQLSYCYKGQCIGEVTEPQFTQVELESGFQLKWVSLSHAITLLKQDQPKNYMGKFIQKRDLALLNKALTLIEE